MTTRSLFKPSVSTSQSLTIIAIVLGIPFLSFYWMALSRLIPDTTMTQSPGWLTPLSIVLYLPFSFFAYTLFGNLYLYILTTIASITAIIMGLVKGQPSKFVRVWLLLLLCATIAFPLFFHYQPALVAAPDYRMQWVTNPGFLGGVIKAAQNSVEKTPCKYELLGWSTDNQLYYQANCSKETQLWQYSPTQESSQRAGSSPPANLDVATVSENSVLGMVRAEGVRPQTYESGTRPILLKSDGLLSPDGKWIAVVTQHIYGTQDLIILTDTE